MKRPQEVLAEIKNKAKIDLNADHNNFLTITAMEEYAKQFSPRAISDDQLRLEINHIFESGANEIRIFELFKRCAIAPRPSLTQEEIQKLWNKHCCGILVENKFASIMTEGSFAELMEGLTTYTSLQLGNSKKYEDTEADGIVFCGKCGKQK